jgi:hypothetical protein
VSQSEASPTGFNFPGSGSQSNLHNLGQIGQLVGANRGLSIHDMALEQPGSGQYDEQKKAKVEVKSMGFGASSSSSGAAAEGTAETFTVNQSEQAHNNNSASNWHQAHHHAQAYTSSQYPTGFFNQVQIFQKNSSKISQTSLIFVTSHLALSLNPVLLTECRGVEMMHSTCHI